MEAGQLDRKLTPQTPTSVDDGHGGQTVTWADGAPFSAHVRDMSSRETLASNIVMSRRTFLVTTRHRTDLTTAMRLYWPLRTKTMEIVAVRDLDEGRNRWVELECVEVHL